MAIALLAGNTRIAILPIDTGWWVVHTFFVISGFMMINSCEKHKEEQSSDIPKSALDFVLNKAKGMACVYTVSCVLYYLIFAIVRLSAGEEIYIFRFITELLGLESAFDRGYMFNGPVWYISAMLVAMLPLAAILKKNRSLYIYVFAPLLALLLHGYMSITRGSGTTVSRFSIYFIFTGALILALCGLCFGAISWIVYERLSKIDTKGICVAMTIAEAALYVVFAACFFNPNGTVRDAYSVMLLIPLWLAIVFSKKSYISKLFKFKFMKCFGGLSLYIYLNHWVAVYIVQMLLPDRSYKLSLMVMFALTAASCVVCYLVVKACKKLWNSVLREKILGT